MESLSPGTNYGFYSQVYKLFKFEEPTMDLVWDLNDDRYEPGSDDCKFRVLPWSQLMIGLAT